MLAIPLKALDPVNTRTSKLFGKAPYVLLISSDGSAGVLQNEFTSGRELAAELVRRGVKTLITNHLGQKAYDILDGYNIKMLYNEERISVLLTLDAYRAGCLKPFEQSMIQEAKHRNEGECCGHEHGGEHMHGHGGGRCCEKDGGEKQREGKGRCCQKN